VFIFLLFQQATKHRLPNARQSSSSVLLLHERGGRLHERVCAAGHGVDCGGRVVELVMMMLMEGGSLLLLLLLLNRDMVMAMFLSHLRRRCDESGVRVTTLLKLVWQHQMLLLRLLVQAALLLHDRDWRNFVFFTLCCVSRRRHTSGVAEGHADGRQRRAELCHCLLVHEMRRQLMRPGGQALRGGQDPLPLQEYYLTESTCG
jgi:hypothetical protein